MAYNNILVAIDGSEVSNTLIKKLLRLLLIHTLIF